ncbi:Pycsar system effector family protein [Streptomyces sp. NPDC046465]|uniref:Pycsar system effector family protein n=1 Tax=Streptomyces sp. NPDC046465 TaxID=3155810 RepID=UPI0033F96583
MASRAQEEAAVVRAELASANTQASVVLAGLVVAVGSLAGHAEVLFRQAWPVVVLGASGVGAVAAAVWLLLGVVLPRLDASGRGSFLTWAACDPDALRDALAADHELDELRVLSRIAVAKYAGLKRSGRLIKSALVLLAAAGLLSAL